MYLLKKFIKEILKIIFFIRNSIPLKIFTIIRNLIKKRELFRILFSLPNGIFIRRVSKCLIRLIPLNKKMYPLPIYALDISSVDAFYEIFIDQVYEKYYKVESGDIIIDIGANVGIFTIKMAKQVGQNGIVIAIEPEPNNLSVLKLNTLPYKNVRIIPQAAGDTSGRIDLLIGIHSGSHTLKIEDEDKINKKIIEVPIDSLDNIIDNLNLNRIDFVKIDVEGWELAVLKGAEKILNMIKHIAIASYHYSSENINLKEFLEKRNFKVIKGKTEIYAFNKKFLI